MSQGKKLVRLICTCRMKANQPLLCLSDDQSNMHLKFEKLSWLLPYQMETAHALNGPNMFCWLLLPLPQANWVLPFWSPTCQNSTGAFSIPLGSFWLFLVFFQCFSFFRPFAARNFFFLFSFEGFIFFTIIIFCKTNVHVQIHERIFTLKNARMHARGAHILPQIWNHVTRSLCAAMQGILSHNCGCFTASLHKRPRFWVLKWMNRNSVKFVHRTGHISILLTMSSYQAIH